MPLVAALASKGSAISCPVARLAYAPQEGPSRTEVAQSRYLMRRLLVVLTFLAMPNAAGAQSKSDGPLLVLDSGGHAAKVWRTLFTPDGKSVLTVSDDKTIRLWDVATAAPL